MSDNQAKLMPMCLAKIVYVTEEMDAKAKNALEEKLLEEAKGSALEEIFKKQLLNKKDERK